MSRGSSPRPPRSSGLLAVLAVLAGLTAALLAAPTPAAAQRAAGDAPDGAASRFGDLAAGPYERLVIRGVHVIPGHGGPPRGAYDLVIQGDSIAAMHRVSLRSPPPDSLRPNGERVIDAAGMYVMPGMIDLHHHLRSGYPLEYVYYLKLAHGVTTTVPAPDRGLEEALAEARRSARNEILAPRMVPIWSWGDGTEHERPHLEDPANAPEVAREMAAEGAHVVYLNGLAWNAELFGAAAEAVAAAGGVTGVHIPPSATAVTKAVDAARMGVTMILHHYGYAESSLDRDVQGFPPDYDFNDELERFRQAGYVWGEADEERLLGEVADSLAAYGVAMVPTRVVYEANRDLLRARSLPWHEKYTHQRLLDLYLPSFERHGAYFYDWTSEDEQAWVRAFDLWGDLIGEFNARGGTVAYGTDDAYIWATPGFSNVRELQLVREGGLHPLEVLESATRASALALRRPDLGLVHPGQKADLVIVDGSPARSLRYLYSFGALRLDDEGEISRTRGVVHTIKDGIVIENDRLMEEVARMVAESREGKAPNPVTEPFEVERK